MTHVRHDDGELWVERVVQLPHGSLVAPEGVVVLAVLSVRVADRSEHFVPGGGVSERLRDAVRRLPARQQQGRGLKNCFYNAGL